MPKKVIVAVGDGISRLASEHGFACDTIWNDESNAELRKTRTNPNILLPGDVVHIPDKRTKTVAAATGRCHVFRRRSIPARFRLQVFHGTVPGADEEFTLLIDGVRHAGRTDVAGMLEVWISPSAKRGVLTFGTGDSAQTRELAFGHLDPTTAPSGLAQRLHNLGYLSATDADDDALAVAIRAFQSDAGIAIDGIASEETAARLEAIHDHKAQYPVEDAANDGEDDSTANATPAEAAADDWEDNGVQWEPPAGG